ncbi:hypothetical protein HanLR1_Chr14g0551311 [Helianthus annuus]|nr:hypothetical protein HanLR1_Chr14g0551311 [Helianthus annuus]
MSNIKKMETTVGRHRRVIMFPLPYQGHVNPMFQLANLLYSKGFSITIFHTNFNKPKPPTTLTSLSDSSSTTIHTMNATPIYRCKAWGRFLEFSYSINAGRINYATNWNWNCRRKMNHLCRV